MTMISPRAMLCFAPHHNLPNLFSAEEKDRLAGEVLHVLLTTDKPALDLKAQIDDILTPYEWYGGLAKTVLDLFVENPNGQQMGAITKRAFYLASSVASKNLNDFNFCKAAPAMTVAIGTLAQVVPSAVEALGFGENGRVVEG